jgi:Holliday junction resolvase RusA-like endonuclease
MKRHATKQLEIQIDYPGSVISVNHYRGRGYNGQEYVKPEAKAFKEMIGWQIKSASIEEWQLPIRVTCSGFFRDERSAPDLSNLSKTILDAIQETTGINDKYFRWSDGDRKIVKDITPYLLIVIEEAQSKAMEG